MKFPRFFLRFAIFAVALVALVAILLAIAFVPAVQTWIGRIEIDRQPGLRGSVGAISAGFGKFEASDVHLEYAGAALTLPSVKAVLPIKAAVWNRKFLIQSVVAKGWTLDLDRVVLVPDGTGATAPAFAKEASGTSWPDAASDRVRIVLDVLGGILGRWNFPCDLSVDGLDLEGDILVAGPEHDGSVKVHVTVKGGGIFPGHEGVIAITADGVGLDARNQPVIVAGRARVAVAMGSLRTLNRITFKSDISAKGGSLPDADALTLSAAVTADRTTHEETGSFDLGMGGRHLAAVSVRYSAPFDELQGNWKVAASDSDWLAFEPERVLPAFRVAGEGTLKLSRDLTRIQAAGHLAAVVERLGVLAPALAGAGPVTLDGDFDLTYSGRTLRFGNTSIAIAGKRPIALVHLLQPIELDGPTRRMTLADPAGDCAEISVQGFPVDWLTMPGVGISLAGANATGKFAVRVVGDGFNLRPIVPLTAAGVSIRNPGGAVSPGFDLALSLAADWTPENWQMQWAPLTLANGGRTWVTLAGNASRSGIGGQPVAISATWNADLDAMASHPDFPEGRRLKGRSVSGDFAAQVAAAGPTKIDGKFTVLGHNVKDSLAANMSVEFGGSRALHFHVPLRVAIGSEVSDVSVDGTALGPAGGSRIDLTLSGKSASLEQLRLLAAPLLGATGADSTGMRAGSAGQSAAAGMNAPLPFWGKWTGLVALDFDQLRVAGRKFDYVHGTFNLDRNSIRLDHGLVKLVQDRMTSVDGALSFDPAAAMPYVLNASASLGEVDAVPLVSETPPKGDPVITGRFTVAATLAGAGRSLDDLLARTREEFRLTSHGGAFRLLKTDVAAALPPPPDSSAMADALGRAGAVVGKFFGSDRRSRDSGSGLIKLGKNTQAVLNFSYAIAEFSYDELTLTAIREPDGSIRLEDLALTAAEVRLTGSGRMNHMEGLPLRAQPLSLDLQFGARNAMATLLATGGLLSSRKDSLGYTLMERPIHLSGTLGHIDDAQWRDLLAEAAERKPDAGDKPGTMPATAKP